MVHFINFTSRMNGRLCKSSLFKEPLCIISSDRSVVRPAVSAETELTHDGFWRIALGEDGVDCLLASSKDVKLQDFRVRPFISWNEFYSLHFRAGLLSICLQCQENKAY